MVKKGISLGILLCLIFLGMIPTVSSQSERHDIRVAIYDEVFIVSSGLAKFLKLFNGYEWMVGDTTYRFVVTQLSDKDILLGRLSTQNYDVFIMPGGGGGGNAILTKSNTRLPWVRVWRSNMINFIKDGGGYFAVCGGTYFLLGLDRPPHSPYEKYIDKSSLGVSALKLSFDSYATPLFCQWVGLKPEDVGHAAYLYYTGWNSTQPHHSGIPLDVPVNRSHPIFADYLTETVHMRWIAGPAYDVPDQPDRELSILARYPIEEISDNISTQIHAWKYIGGLRGFLPGFFKYITVTDTFPKGTTNVYAHAGDWVKTDAIIQTNFSQKPFMVAEVYPNTNAARIIVCAGHPEFPVWWGGHIEDVNETRHNSLYDSLYQWVDVTGENNTIQDEETYTWWIVLRGTAWAAKIPNECLPPVYGASQVRDISPYEQPSRFTLMGTTQLTTGVISMELYYRYSSDNSSWGPWAIYGMDTDGSDGWQWDYDASLTSGPGYYQFYSLRHVQSGNEWITEIAPPGPDATAHVS